MFIHYSVYRPNRYSIRSITRHEYLTDQALLPYTETKSMLIVRTATGGSLKGKVSLFHLTM